MSTLMLLTILCCTLDPELGEREAAALLDEVIAGNEANSKNIEKGTAEYTMEKVKEGGKPVQRSDYSKLKYPEDYTLTLHFDGPKARWDFAHCRCFRDDQLDVVFDTYELDTNPAADPSESSVFLYAKGRGHDSPFICHPRYTGHGLECVTDSRYTPRSLADVLRKAKQKPDVCKLKLTREGTLIKIVNDMPSLKARDEYWVAPKQGYSVVKELRWGTKDAKKLPYMEVHTEYQCEAGAFVAKKCIRLERVPDRDAQVEQPTRCITLKKISLTDKPDAKLFTLDGLGLPKGARVQDRRTGTEKRWME